MLRAFGSTPRFNSSQIVFSIRMCLNQKITSHNQWLKIAFDNHLEVYSHSPNSVTLVELFLCTTMFHLLVEKIRGNHLFLKLLTLVHL